MVPVTCGTSYKQQGRSEAAGRDRRLHARPPLDMPRDRRCEPRYRMKKMSATRTITLRSPLSRSRSRPTRSSASLSFVPRVLRYAEYRYRGSTTPPSSRRERIGRILQMHANHREDIEMLSTPATSPPSSACKNTTTGDTLCDEKAPDHPGVAWNSPSP